MHFPWFERISWQVHLHVVTIALWLAMLVVQGWLVNNGQIGAHPGLVGAALFDGGFFLFCYAMAIARRRNPLQHSTYMMLTPVAFINPSLGRAWAPEASVPIQAALLSALLVAAWMRRGVWQPFAVVLAGWCVTLLMVLLTSVVAPQIINGLWDAIWA